jgi:large exoprotein involved in heme utilization and adhesion
MDSTTFGDGAGGAITINASESVHISGTGNGMRSNARGAGAAGEVAIATPMLAMSEGAVVAAETSGTGPAGNIRLAVGTLSMSGGSSVTSSALGEGQGGTITVVGGDLATITGSVLSSTAAGSRPGGDIVLAASEVRLTDGAEVTATSAGRGDAGSIRIVARDSLVSQGSRVETNSASGAGGNIELQVGELLRLSGSGVTATATGGDRRGGNITIGAPAATAEGALVSPLGDGVAPGPGAAIGPTDFVLLERSEIRANAFGGPGGNVQINAGVFLQTGSQITASSALGLQGSVDVNAQITDVSGTIAALPESILQAAALLRDSCAARVGSGKTSTLAQGSRDGLPGQPGATASSPLAADIPALAPERRGHAGAVTVAAAGHARPAGPAPLTLRCFR